MRDIKKRVISMILAVFLIGVLIPVAFGNSVILNAELVSKTLEAAIKEHTRYLKFLKQEIVSIDLLIEEISDNKVLSRVREAKKRLESVLKITENEIATKRGTIEHNFRLIEGELETIALRKTPHFNKPDSAFFDITLKELSDNQEFYSTKNVALSGWIRKQVKEKDSRYAFFSFGLNDDEITLIFDTTKIRFRANIIDQPFYVMGEFVTEISVETDFKSVEVKSALLVSFISKNWEMLK